MTGSDNTSRSSLDSTIVPCPVRSTRRGDSAEVVGIIGSDAESFERSLGGRHEYELFAAVTGGQRPSPASPKSWKKAVDAATSGTPSVMEVKR